jgi:hypothetical protein
MVRGFQLDRSHVALAGLSLLVKRRTGACWFGLRWWKKRRELGRYESIYATCLTSRGGTTWYFKLEKGKSVNVNIYTRYLGWNNSIGDVKHRFLEGNSISTFVSTAHTRACACSASYMCSRRVVSFRTGNDKTCGS